MLDQCNRMARETLLLTYKTQTLARRRLDVHTIDADVEISGDIRAHGFAMFAEPRCIGEHCAVDVHDTKSSLFK